MAPAKGAAWNAMCCLAFLFLFVAGTAAGEAADFCTNSCDYREDGSCDDGGANAEYQGCPVGTDCMDCGVRQKDIYSEPPKYHTFQRGDSLYRLQQKYGGSIAAMLRWNGLWDVRSVKVGQRLAVNPSAGLEREKNVAKEERSRRRRVAIIGRVLASEKLFGDRFNDFIEISNDDSIIKKVDRKLCKQPTPSELVQNPLPSVEEPFKSFSELEELYQPNEENGWWSPTDCEATDTVAIVVPYRNREHYLKGFLSHMHPLLRKQNLRYQIFIIDQTDKKKFNRAKLLNVGAHVATKVVPLEKAVAPGYNFCFVMHDVDMVSMSDAMPYGCPKDDEPGPRHLSVYTVSHRNKCLYKELFGGVASMSYQHMINVNGYSNLYFGWGGEDDDMSSRVRVGAGMKIMRPKACSGPCRVFGDCMKDMGLIPGYENVDDENYGIWYMMGGRPEDVREKQMNPDHMQYLVYAEQRYPGEGLNTLEYTLVGQKQAYGGLYVHVKAAL